MLSPFEENDLAPADEEVVAYKDAAAFESRFAESSIDEIRDLKQKADEVVQETMTNMTNGSEENISALIPVVIEIMDGYKKTTTL